MIDWSSLRHRHSRTNGWFSSLLTESSSEPALDNTATSDGVAQLTGHLTAAVLHITDIVTGPTLPQLTNCQIQ